MYSLSASYHIRHGRQSQGNNKRRLTVTPQCFNSLQRPIQESFKIK